MAEVSRKTILLMQSPPKLPPNWPFALRHEHNLCKKNLALKNVCLDLRGTMAALKETYLYALRV